MDFDKKLLNIKKYQTSDLHDVSRFIAGLNKQPEHHIAFFGTTPDEIVHYLLEEQSIPPEESYLIAYYRSDIAGVIGLEYDLDLKRAWIEGPLVNPPHWKKIAQVLYSTILNLIPESINDFELACDVRNTNLGEFALEHGYYNNTDAALLISGENTYPDCRKFMNRR